MSKTEGGQKSAEEENDVLLKDVETITKLCTGRKALP